MIYSSRNVPLSQGLLQSFLEHLPYPFLILDPQDHILYASPEACNLLGGALQGETLASAIRAPIVIDAIRNARLLGEPLVIEYVRRFPVPRHFEVTITPLKPISGEFEASFPPGHLSLLLRDFSAEHRLERAQGDFIAYASHELKTPLTAILGFIETLQHSVHGDPEAQKHFLVRIFEEGQRMRRLIEDLLSLSILAMPANTKTYGMVSLWEAADRARDMLKDVFEQKKMTIDLSLDKKREIFGHLSEMVQVFRNLFENALKYASCGETLSIRDSVSEDGTYIVSIQDFGPGIAPEHLPRLTERFYRVTPGGVGSGLGLTIVENILERHGAKLQVFSRLGEGARFDLVFPSERFDFPE